MFLIGFLSRGEICYNFEGAYEGAFKHDYVGRYAAPFRRGKESLPSNLFLLHQ